MNDDTINDSGVSRRGLLQAGGAAVAAGALSGVFGAAQARPAATASADISVAGTPFPHVWERAVGGDHSQQVLRRDYQDQLFQCRDELGIQPLRFHGILNDGLSTYLSSYPANYTQDSYSFFNVDEIYGALVENGMHPLVELSDMPAVLAANPTETLFFKYPFKVTPS